MVRTLFGKILLWSVAVQFVTVGTAFALMTAYLPESQEAIDNAFQLYADTAVAIYERFGVEAVDSFLARSGSNTLMYLKLSASDPGSDCGPSNDEVLSVLAKGQGGAYCLTVKAKRGELPERPETRRARLQLAIMLELLSCPALSYAIARYLTRPISQLRGAADRLAKGDLSARVGPRYARRRDEAADLVREFDQMADHVAALIEAQRRLIGDVSHEIKSPLARLGVALGLAQRDVGDYAPRQFARMQRELDNISQIVGELLTLASLNAATARLPDDRFDLGEAVDGVVSDIAFETPDRVTDIVWMPPEAPIPVRGDRALMARAVNNIVRNAVFYTAPGAVIAVTCAVEDGRVRLAVTDQGPGVPADALPRLFDPFYRVGDDRSRRTGGTGIGLAICRSAVQLHGGTVRACNVEPHGLEIVIDLPQAEAETPLGQDSTQLHTSLR